MSNIHTVIGTAGHVDHGKTSLIKALTGIETDRLKEEKRRQITIELGFAYLTLPNGERAGIIDVPGHERFIRNMLSGASSIDLVLLVIAADEGIMPQTREHLDILSLLNIQRGVVVLTKADLVDNDWLEMVLDDIRNELKDTFLNGAPIMPVSSFTGEGIPELKQCLFELLKQAPDKAKYIPFRMPVDRVFTSEGFGAVVTGTLIEGELNTGDNVTIFPSMKTAKVRTLQAHSEKVPSMHAGQRAAVNLSGISHNDLQKGDVLGAPGSMINSTLLDVRLDVLKGTNRKLLHGSQLHFHHGTQDILCKLLLLDRQSAAKGESVYAQIQLCEPLPVKPGDRFIVRFYSPLETVGGGVILDHSPKKHVRNDQKILDAFKVKENGAFAERISQMVLDRSKTFPVLDEIKYLLFENNPQFDKEAAALLENGELIRVGDKRVIHKQFFEAAGQRCKEILAAYHAKNPLNPGMPKSELWRPLLPRADSANANKVIDLLAQHGIVKLTDGLVANPDFNVVMSGQHRKLSDVIVKELLDWGYSTLSLDDMIKAYEKDKTAFKQAFDALVKDGTVVMLTPQIVIHKDFLARAMQTFKKLAAKNPVTLVDFRDALQTSRKYALALLEYFDIKNFTQKNGDTRELK